MVRDMSFKPDECVLLNVSLEKGVMQFSKKGRLNPHYIGLFEVFLQYEHVRLQVGFSTNPVKSPPNNLCDIAQ